MSADTLHISDTATDHAAIERAAQLLTDGGIVVFPTETVYGIGASAAHPLALDRLRRVKHRPVDQPFTVHIPDAQAVARYVEPAAQPALMRLAARTMPGPITFIVDASDDTIAEKLHALGLPPDARDRLYHGRTIGLRCPDHPVAQRLLAAVPAPVVASSANVAGEEPPTSASQIARSLGGDADLILDTGPTRFARASTIVRVDGSKLEVIREGVYDRRYLEKLMRRTILFVCSGNTCRSPMAEAIARAELSARLGVPADDLESAGLRVVSAGAYAMPGAPMSPEAADALRQMGINPGRHTARALTPELVRDAERIFTMTQAHRAAVIDLAPEAAVADKTEPLDPAGGIEDPIGAGSAVYLRCADRIRKLIRRRLDEMGLPVAG